jgi:hypothetical protein
VAATLAYLGVLTWVIIDSARGVVAGSLSLFGALFRVLGTFLYTGLALAVPYFLFLALAALLLRMIPTEYRS